MIKKTNPFYRSKKWKKKREVILRRDGYLCQESKRYGKSIPADMVHHIYPLEEYPELGLVNWNLVALSNREHNKMHDRLTNEITYLGKRWQRKFKKEFEQTPHQNVDLTGFWGTGEGEVFPSLANLKTESRKSLERSEVDGSETTT